MEKTRGQSINLAMSFRGREALKAIDLEDILATHGTCMRGRMLHNKDGNLKEVLYDSVKGNVHFYVIFTILNNCSIFYTSFCLFFECFKSNYY